MARLQVLVAAILLLSALSLLPTHAAVLSFSIDEPDRNFVFVSRFCLRPSSAAAPQNDTLHLQASFNETAEAPVLVLYSGDRDSTSYFGDVWGDDDNSPAACRRKVARAIGNTSYPLVSGEALPPLTFAVDHPQYLFAVLADCSGESFSASEVESHWENFGSGWYKEFSYDQKDLLTLFLVYFLFWMPLALLAMGVLVRLYQTRCFNTASRVLVTALYFYYFAIFFILIHYAVYAFDGFGVPAFLVMGDTFYFLSNCMLVSVLFLLARQMTGIFEVAPITVHVLIISVMFMVQTALFVWDELYPYLYPASVSTRFESTPGILMLCMRICFWAYWAYIAAMTVLRRMQNNDLTSLMEKIFWSGFLGWFTIWFLYLPLIVLLALAGPEYDRPRVVTSFLLTMDFLTYTGLLLAFLNVKYNPFLSFCTTQVDVEEEGVTKPLADRSSYGALSAAMEE